MIGSSSRIPAVLLALTAGVEPAIAAVLLYVGIPQVENNVLVPKTQGDAVQLHPTIVMFALVVGGAIGGLMGAILALPIAAAGRDVFRYLFHRVDEPGASPSEALAIIAARPMIVDRVVAVPADPPLVPGTAAPAEAPDPPVTDPRPPAAPTPPTPPSPEGRP